MFAERRHHRCANVTERARRRALHVNACGGMSRATSGRTLGAPESLQKSRESAVAVIGVTCEQKHDTMSI